MKLRVLDASAALAAIRSEPGQDVVIAALAERVAMTTVNFAEVATWLADRGASRAQLQSALADLGCELTPVDAEMALDIGMLRPLTRPSGLSLGDRACLALARRLGCPALTTDRRWAEVAGAVGVEVELIR